MRTIAVAASGAVGYFLYRKGIFLPCFIDCAFIGMPFFYFGYILKKSGVLISTKYDKFNIPVAVFLFATAVLIDIHFRPIMFFHDKEFSGNVISMILLPLTSVSALLLLCKSVKRVPVVSYIGRYSIIPLCIHHLIYRPIALVVYRYIAPEDGGSWLVALATIALCIAAIPLCKRHIPQFTAQKEFIKQR